MRWGQRILSGWQTKGYITSYKGNLLMWSPPLAKLGFTNVLGEVREGRLVEMMG